MATVTPFPTAEQRAVLSQLDAVFASRGVPEELRQKARARFLENKATGRSDAVAVCECRRTAYGRPTPQRGPSAA